MGAGKIAAQAGHAYTETLKVASPQTEQYLLESPGTKVCLAARNLEVILWAQQRAIEHGIPHALITDSGHQAFFGGRPTVTAFGFGPCTRAQAKPIAKKLGLLP